VRYLKARDFDLKKSTEMLHNTLQWRRDFKPDEITFEEMKGLIELGSLYPVE
jgi:hypothetical protein